MAVVGATSVLFFAFAGNFSRQKPTLQASGSRTRLRHCDRRHHPPDPDADPPFIKLEAVKALDKDYANTEAAMAGIADALTTAYREEHAEFVDDGREQLPNAIHALQTIYRDTIFPEMKAQWSAHPDNIGHRDGPGCFRCHNDPLESSDGKTIFTTCDRCHVILSQGSDGEKLSVDVKKGKTFVHPEDGEEIDEYSDCSDCHAGGAALYE